MKFRLPPALIADMEKMAEAGHPLLKGELREFARGYGADEAEINALLEFLGGDDSEHIAAIQMAMMEGKTKH